MRRLLSIANPDGESSLSDAEIWGCYPWPHGAGPPWVRANMTASVDGRVAGSQGRSRDVSSAADRRVFGILRAGCDAIVVGARTAIAENYGPVRVRPDLAALRSADGRDSAPTVVVVTQSGNLDTTSRLFAGPRRPIVLTHRSGASADLRDVAEVIECGDQLVDLRAGIAELGRLGMRRILCEGGPRLLDSMLRADLIDDLCTTTTPLLVGPPSSGLKGTGSLLASAAWDVPPLPLQLAGVLEEADTLLCRWVVDPDGRRQRAMSAGRR